MPLTEVDVGGGAWRIKWHPSSARKHDLLVASMHDGFKVVRFGPRQWTMAPPRHGVASLAPPLLSTGRMITSLWRMARTGRIAHRARTGRPSLAAARSTTTKCLCGRHSGMRVL